MLSFLLIAFESNSISIRNRYGDKGHPGLTPLDILKKLEKYPLLVIQPLGDEYSSFIHLLKESPKLKCSKHLKRYL